MTQSEMILRYMHENGSITPKEALEDLGCMRLGARIWDIKRTGVKIIKTMEQGENRLGYPTRYARYRLA